MDSPVVYFLTCLWPVLPFLPLILRLLVGLSAISNYTERDPWNRDVPEPMKKAWQIGRWYLAFGVVGFVALCGLRWAESLYITHLHYTEWGHPEVFWILWAAKWKAFLRFFGVGALLAGVLGAPVLLMPRYCERLLLGLLGVMGIAGLVAGIVGTSLSQDLLLANHLPASSASDPVFGIPISDYLAALPIQISIVDGLTVLLFILIGAVAALLGVMQEKLQSQDELADKAEVISFRHIGLLAAVLFAVMAYGVRLDLPEMMWDQSGKVVGVGYTDHHVRAVAAVVQSWIYVGLACLATFPMLFSGSIIRRKRDGLLIGWAGGSLAIVLLSWLALGAIWPEFVQAYRVKNDEYNREEVYIQNDMQYTRQAAGLSGMVERDLQIEPLTQDRLAQYEPTVSNLRIHDWEALQTVYNAFHELRPFYRFPEGGVDVDRYAIGGSLQEVMLAARFLDHNELDGRADTWLNRHFLFTHGFGWMMAAANGMDRSGFPSFLAQGIPMTFSPDVPQPSSTSFYYQEIPSDPVYVQAGLDELHYGREGAEDVMTRYTGAGGIRLRSGLDRLLLARAYDGYKILATNKVLPDSTRILVWRSVKERVMDRLPFLRFDADPLLVVEEGINPTYVCDAYTVSENYPSAKRQPLPIWGGKDVEVNYARNSVKVTLDAVDGTVTCWRFDNEDPILAAWAEIFPTLFHPASEMPEVLRRHIRYPEGLFTFQRAVYREYHVTDPKRFYGHQDHFDIAQEQYWEGTRAVAPYYILLQLEPNGAPQFLIMQPFCPKGKENLTGWLAGLCDGDAYGQLVSYRFGIGDPVLGPMLVENKAEIEFSAEMTLWRQEGSSVYRGNMLTVPLMGEEATAAILHVEPVYLQSTMGGRSYPQLRRVIASADNQIVWSETLGGALTALLGGSTPPIAASSSILPSDYVPKSVAQLAQVALAWMNEYNALVAEGKYSEAGQVLQALRAQFERVQPETAEAIETE